MAARGRRRGGLGLRGLRPRGGARPSIGADARTRLRRRSGRRRTSPGTRSTACPRAASRSGARGPAAAREARIDPTAPDIHLGHAVVLNKLREFQDAGHTVVLIIGDYTARVGDPSGRSATRPMLSGEEIDAQRLTFQEQAGQGARLDERLEVRRNSEWLDMPMEELFRLVRTATVAQLLERDDFAKRWRRASRSPCSSCSIPCCRATTPWRCGPTSSSAAPTRPSTC